MELQNSLHDCAEFSSENLTSVRSSLRSIPEGGCLELLLPYRNQSGDSLSVYAEKDGDSYILSDDTYIYNNLQLLGLDSSPENLEQLKRICRQHRVAFSDGNLSIRATEKNLAVRVRTLAETMLQAETLAQNLAEI